MSYIPSELLTPTRPDFGPLDRNNGLDWPATENNYRPRHKDIRPAQTLAQLAGEDPHGSFLFHPKGCNCIECDPEVEDWLDTDLKTLPVSTPPPLLRAA